MNGSSQISKLSVGIFFLLILSWSCTKQEDCIEISKPDLVCSMAAPVLEVFVGEVAQVLNLVTNIADTIADCENGTTANAGENISMWVVWFRSEGGTDWELISEFEDILIGELEAGESQEDTFDFAFGEAGEYSFSSTVDKTEVVDERDESNNTSEIGYEAKAYSNPGEMTVITVLADPITGNTFIKGIPQLELLND